MINKSQVKDPRMWARWQASGAVRGIKPPPCNREIFELGVPIAALDARAEPAERWVRKVAGLAKASVDWHYSGGVAQVLHLGDEASTGRTIAAILQLENQLDGRIMAIYQPGDPGLYRKGVTPAPEGAIASWMDLGTGQAAFAVA